MSNERINLQDTTISAILKICEENPGAMSVCSNIIIEGEEIDPDNVLGGFGLILLMDTYGIYGSRIWMLYKDVCKESIVKTVAVLRACQLGILREACLHTAIDNYGKGIDVNDLYKQVKARLPSFADIVD